MTPKKIIDIKALEYECSKCGKKIIATTQKRLNVLVKEHNFWKHGKGVE